MLGVILTGSNGEALQLANNKTATLTFAIAASQLSSAPASIPLWYFDETTSLWKEEGTATKVNNIYIGDVKHFSWWNCDIGTFSPIVKGRVVDCNGVPVPNCVVTFNSWATTVADQNGNYQGRVPTMYNLSVQVLAINNSGVIQNSQIENIPTLAPQQTYIVPDLVVPCITRVIGTIKTCSGEASDGFVCISNISFFYYQFTVNGIFNIPTIGNVQVNLFALNSSDHSYSQNITTLSAPNNLNVGNLLLCDISSQPDNSFYISGNGHNHELIQIDTTSTNSTYIPSMGFITNVIGVNHSNGQSATVHFELTDTLPGNYLCDSSAINIFYIDLDNEMFFSYYQNFQSTVKLNDVQYLGGRVKGTFSGTLSPIDTLIAGSVLITNGRFNVLRTQ
jgi:hypothetical protein